MAGLYFHIPFCLRKCHYCDFTSFTNLQLQGQYTDSIIKEIHLKKDILQTREWSTIFIGGGTPSLLSIDNLDKILEKLVKTIDISKIKEFTIEVNPKTLTGEKLKFYKANNINRLSIGVQTFNQLELKGIGRIHTPEDAFETISLAKELGFTNISLDLIYGLPFQTIETLKDSLKIACDLGINHISFYGLQVEEGTILEKQLRANKIKIPSEETQRKMYLVGTDYLTKRGFSQYEVSNFAFNNKVSLHNYNYWLHGDYLGFGISSYSKIGDRRFANTKDLKIYLNKLERDIIPIDEEEFLSLEEREFEQKMLLLRTEKGILLKDVKYKNKIAILIENGLGYIENNRLKLTPEGFLLSNEIINTLI